MSREKLLQKLEDDLEVTPYLFVYGTLKFGEWNYWSYLLSSDYIGPRVTSDRYLMVDVGYPYAYPEHLFERTTEWHKPILGDLFELYDPQVLHRVDMLEGEGFHYHRQLIMTTEGELCWMYHKHNPYPARSFGKCNITENGEWQWLPR